MTITGGDTITVDVTDTYRPKFLSFIGIGDLTVTSQASARIDPQPRRHRTMTHPHFASDCRGLAATLVILLLVARRARSCSSPSARHRGTQTSASSAPC